MITARKLLIAALAGAGALTAAHLIDPSTASAQSTTTGAIQGVLTDATTGEALVGVTITVTSPALQGAQSTISEGDGSYKITNLPPGEYLITFYYLTVTVERGGVAVGVNKATPVYQKINSDDATGETIKIEDSAPTIDPTSTTQGITIDKAYIKNIPVPGRTFEATLGAAAGSQGDALGVSFSGSSSLENQYVVDGVNTTGLTFGTVGSPIINDFIEEIEVITGGYNAEFGRATGGIVNVVTKSGSNEFKGSVFGTYQPGQLTYNVERAPTNAASIDAQRDNAYNLDGGFEIGGPIIKDKVWFYVGFAPRFQRLNITRTVKRQTDCRVVQPNGQLSTCEADTGVDPMDPAAGGRDGVADVDPTTGFYITEDVDRSTRTAKTDVYNTLAKINFAVSPEHQGQIAFQGLPARIESPAIFGPESSGQKASQLTTDVSAKWTSKFNDNKTEVEAIIGWHRDYVKTEGFDPMLANDPLEVLIGGNLGVFSQAERFGESQRTRDLCTDGGTDDDYPQIDNCPMDAVSYVIGGPGAITDDEEQRIAGRINVTQRLRAAGSHEIKGGMDVERNTAEKARLYSGGGFVQNFLQNDTVLVNRWVQLAGLQGSPSAEGADPRFDSICNTPNPEGTTLGGSATLNYACDFLEGTYGSPGTQITGETLNWSAYLRDSWQIKPNFTLNLGLRYEEQRLRYAEGLANEVDPLTGVQLGKNAMDLRGMFAPRLGILYDWTKEGRSKIYANYGRYYESIPMQINDRSFGGEVNYQQQFNSASATCARDLDGDGMPDPQTNPDTGGVPAVDCLGATGAANEQLIGASGTLVAPGIKAQYLDEIIGGAEYEIVDDFKIGFSLQRRWMGRVIEDVSTDGATTYIIANPGEWDPSEEAALLDRIERTDDPIEQQRLQNQLYLYQGIRQFDKPTRTYTALQFTATRRFSKKLYVQGSYTYQQTRGNYPGLISYDNGQVDPNISSQYDLIELLANRTGPLFQDKPHYIKLDGYYTFDFEKAGELTVGVRLRALSGTPQNALAGHYLYGAGESFLLPRGQLGRTPFDHTLGVHVGYKKKLAGSTTLEVYTDLFNIYNRQATAGVDDVYAPRNKLNGTVQNANPVSGGTYEDLIWVKTINNQGGETQTPIGRNPNFRNTNARQAPGYVQLGVRLTF